MKTTPFFSLLLVCMILVVTLGACAKPPADAPVSTIPTESDDNIVSPTVRFENTVATVDPMGHPVIAEGSNGTTPFRLLPERDVKTTRQAIVYIDNGASIILDAETSLRVDKDLTAHFTVGRAWVRVHSDKEWRMEIPGGHLLAREAAFNVTMRPEGVVLHHLEGELTAVGPKPERLRGGTFLLNAQGIQARPLDLFIDWTGGLYRATATSSGYGVLRGRTSGSLGLAEGGIPLILRNQKVNVKIRRRTAITEVEQIFFNPSSIERDGDWRVKLPEGAVILEVFLARQNNQWMLGTIKPVIPNETLLGDGAFFMTGENEYGMLIKALPPAGEVGIRLRYAQKLADVGGRRLYRYPMRGGTKTGEFELNLRVLDPDAALRSGWEGTWERQIFSVRKNDFLPMSDFVAEVFPKTSDETLLEVAKTDEKRKLFMLSLPLSKVAHQLSSAPRFQEPSVVFLLDFSASMDSSKIQVLKTAFSSLFEKMQGIRTAVFLLRGDVTPLDERGLDVMDESRRKRFLETLGSLNPAGATDLGKAIENATVLIPNGDGIIVYVGDGKPTRGPMTAQLLASRLTMSSPAPVFNALLLGRPEPNNVLETLGKVTYVEEVGELGQRLNTILQELEKASFKDLQVNLGPDVARLTPTRILTASTTDTLTFFGYFTQKIPESVALSGLYASRPFSIRIAMSTIHTTDTDVLKKLWASSRLRDLVARGSGREAVIQLAMDAHLVTPYTGLSFLYSGTTHENIQIPYVIHQEIPRLPEYEHAALRNLPPAAVSGLALPDLEPNEMHFDIATYYRALLNRGERREAVDQCYQRKAVFTPMAGGSVTFELTVDVEGRWKKLERKASTLTDTSILECMERALRLSPSLPAPPMGEITFTHTYTFASSGQVLPQECSALSRAYIEDRKRAWRQKMPYNGDAYQAETLWKSAKAGCELETWTERRAFLEVIMERMGNIQQKLALAQLLLPEGDAVTAFVREQILRSIRTPEEAQLVVAQLALHGGQLYAAFLSELARWREKEGAKLSPDAMHTSVLAFARGWRQLDPENAALTLFAMHAAIQAGETDIAQHWGMQLLERKDLTAGQRENLAELFMKLQQPRLAHVVISTSVEMAPYDPWTRKRMGDFFRRHHMIDDALAEYDFLAWLLPQAPEPKVLVADTYLSRGNWELGLQTYEQLLQTQNFALTPYLLALHLAQFSDRPEISATQLRARVRRNGLLDHTKAMVVLVRTLEGFSDITVYRGPMVTIPPKEPEIWEKPTLLSGVLGMTLFHSNTTRIVTLRFESQATPQTRFLPPARHQIIVVRNLWQPAMTVQTLNVTQRPGFFQYITIPEKGDLPAPNFSEIPKKTTTTPR